MASQNPLWGAERIRGELLKARNHRQRPIDPTLSSAPVGAENPIPSSGGDLVLVNEPAESVASVNSPDVDHAPRLDRYGTGRGALVEGAMRPMSVVVPEINPQHLL